MKELTRAEEDVMQILWELKKGFVKDILAQMKEPRPAYNTVSTIIRILQEKGFVSHRAFGKTHQYFPLVSKKDYTDFTVKNVANRYFDGSFRQMVSFFARDKKISVQDLDRILEELNKKEK